MSSIDAAAIIAATKTATAQLTAPEAPYAMQETSYRGISYRQYVNAPKSFRELLDAGRVHGETTFVDYNGDTRNFVEFFAEVDAIAVQMVAELGVGKGDRVAVAMRNYPEWLSSFAAAASLGAVVVPLNSWGRREELVYALNHSGAKVVFCDRERYDHIADDAAELGFKIVVVRSDAELNSNARHFAEFIAGGEGKQPTFFDVGDDDPALLMYTSGTTGLPKGALSTQRAVCQAVYNLECQATISAMTNPKAIEAMFSGGHAPTSLVGFPLFHVSGCHAQFLLSVRGGRKLVLMYKWDAAEAIRLTALHKVTILSLTPTQLIDFFELAKSTGADISSLCSLGSGGSASPPKVLRLADDVLGSPYFGGGYGMTESNAVCASATGDAYRAKPGCSGIVAPIVDVESRDENGNVVPAGEPGELWIKSITCISEYLNNPEATAKTFADGWMATGDIGYVDDDGFIFIVDRAKDMVIRGGENIACGEVEGCLVDHPAVQDVAVFGIPHERLGEELAVVVQPKPGTAIDSEEVQAWVKDRLASFKVPSQVFISAEPLPRNVTGKLLKRNIREQFAG